MSQNFSKMSDIYIPELMELDSYWQKAVEDAICDTLKGEKRLYYALRNRKKIKNKLEMLGLKTANTQLSFSALSRVTIGPPEGKESSESSSQRSLSTQEGGSHGVTSGKGKSWRKNGGDPEKRPKTPDRTLLGTGSLEKMKKSQNSFNCEPMGLDVVGDMSESDNCEELNQNEPDLDSHGDRTKKVQWLHVRNDSEFDCSDSESANNYRAGDAAKEKNDFQRRSTVKDKNYFMSDMSGFRSTCMPKEGNCNWMERQFSKSESQWDSESQETIPGNMDLERKLHLALAKKDILNENLNAMSISDNRLEIEVQGSAATVAEKRRKGKRLMSPFIRFYLEVYRELCQKCTAKQIAEEAAKRWWNMTKKQKSTYAESRTDASVKSYPSSQTVKSPSRLTAHERRTVTATTNSSEAAAPTTTTVSAISPGAEDAATGLVGGAGGAGTTSSPPTPPATVVTPQPQKKEAREEKQKKRRRNGRTRTKTRAKRRKTNPKKQKKRMNAHRK